MCFSATASFGASIVLGAIGAASVKKVSHKNEILFASIPLLFSVQQFIEGILWLSMTHDHFFFLIKPTTYLFLAFAQVIWPIWVPLSVLLLSWHTKYKNKLLFLTVIGAVISFYLFYCLSVFPVSASIIEHHIHYELSFPLQVSLIVGILYFMSTVLPPFLSDSIRMRSLSLIVMASYLFTQIFFSAYLISVWCFFAAVISIVVWAVMDDLAIAYKKLQIPLV